MLTVNLYKSIEEFCFEQQDCLKKNIYICPGPLIADGVRSLLGNNAEVLTIAKWVNDQLKKNNQTRIMKSELLLRLSSIWRHYFPEAKGQIFFRAFEIFTDLRSFTLDQTLLHDVLAELDPDLKKSILLFWVYFENEKLIDEQLAYQLVGNDSSTRPICFIGFKHMNAIQIDMLKSLSEYKDVSIAFPLTVYSETLSSDWIKWLLPETSLIDLNNKKQHEEIKVVVFQKNKLNYHLKEFRKNNSHFDIIIPSANMEISQFQEVLNSNVFFKTSVDLFKIEKENLFFELINRNLNIADLEVWLKKKKITFTEVENFRSFKICMMIEESLEIFKQLSTNLDSFFLSVMNQVITLNSPRNFLVSLSTNAEAKLVGLEEQRFEKITSPAIVVASSLYGTLASKVRPYNEKILAVLAVIGPLKRSGLDFLFAKETLHKLLNHENSVLFLEEGLVDSDLAWREILKNKKTHNINIDLVYALKEKRDIIGSNIKFKKQDGSALSASRLQSFTDCPRKYYFSYIEKIITRPEVRLAIDPDEKGNLEHKIIESYFMKATQYDYDLHYALCKNILKEFLAAKKVCLSRQSEEETFYELLEYTKNGITSLLYYKQDYPLATLEFEVALYDSEFAIKGYIDCVLITGNDVHIFDFKRSSTAIGSKKELLSFEKIQLWIYKWVLEKKYTVTWWGYINLSDGIISGMGQAEVAEPQAFQTYLITLMERFKSEREFAPIPRNEKVCHYCELQLFCPKEKLP